MKLNIFIIALLSLLSCNSSKIINTENIDKLTVIVDSLKIAGETKEFYITDRDSISRIVNKLNRAKKEFAKFRPTYRIEINYLDSQKVTILCNAKRITIEGITYKLNEDIKKIININHTRLR